MPANGEAIATRTPVLQWRNTRTEVFYYELQVSRDPTFNVDPATATAIAMPRAAASCPIGIRRGSDPGAPVDPR